MKVIKYTNKKGKKWFEVEYTGKEWAMIIIVGMIISFPLFGYGHVSGNGAGVLVASYVILAFSVFIAWFFVTFISIFLKKRNGTIEVKDA